jgi:hypothetical protein
MNEARRLWQAGKYISRQIVIDYHDDQDEDHLFDDISHNDLFSDD